MKEFLAALLQAVLIAAIPVCATYASKGLKALATYAKTKTDNETAKKYLDDAADAIATAVSTVNQTYVDALKKSGTFTKENQEEALGKAIKEAVNLMRRETITFLKEAYGDLNDYLSSKIEAEVRAQKKEEPLLVGTVELPEVRESPDITTVAAATAAATAATVAQAAISQAASPAAKQEPENSGTVAG